MIRYVTTFVVGCLLLMLGSEGALAAPKPPANLGVLLPSQPGVSTSVQRGPRSCVSSFIRRKPTRFPGKPVFATELFRARYAVWGNGSGPGDKRSGIPAGYTIIPGAEVREGHNAMLIEIGPPDPLDGLVVAGVSDVHKTLKFSEGYSVEGKRQQLLVPTGPPCREAGDSVLLGGCVPQFLRPYCDSVRPIVRTHNICDGPCSVVVPPGSPSGAFLDGPFVF